MNKKRVRVSELEREGRVKEREPEAYLQCSQRQTAVGQLAKILRQTDTDCADLCNEIAANGYDLHTRYAAYGNENNTCTICNIHNVHVHVVALLSSATLIALRPAKAHKKKALRIYNCPLQSIHYTCRR